MEFINKGFTDKFKLMGEIVKKIKDKNSEYDEYYKKTDQFLKYLSSNMKNMEESFKELKENSLPKLTTDIVSITKNYENLNENFTQNLNENVKKSSKNHEKIKEIADENKNLNNKVKEITNLMNNIDNKLEGRISVLGEKNQRSEVKSLDEDFKQEICNRLISDEKKFVEINENILILDKNINTLSKKIEIIESNITPNTPVNHQANCFAYNSCEVHSFRDNFILKGKEDVKMDFITSSNIYEKFPENVDFDNKICKSKDNEIDVKINTNYVRSSEKYKLNNLYLQCEPVNFANYSKNQLKNYLPKYYFSDRKTFVNIVEAYFEMDQENFQDGEVLLNAY